MMMPGGDQLIENVLALLGALKIESMDVISLDWGGYIRWELALALPTRFRRHVVICTGNPNRFLGQQSIAAAKQNWYMCLNTQSSAPAL